MRAQELNIHTNIHAELVEALVNLQMLIRLAKYDFMRMLVGPSTGSG